MENFEMLIRGSLYNVGYAILIILAGFILSKILRSAIRKAFAKIPGDEQCVHRNATVSRILIDTLKYTTYVVIILAVLHVFFGTTIQSFLAVAGVGGIAIGFGAQNLIRDLISGFFLILDGQLAIGDDVTIGGCTGIVEDIGLRATRIRCENGALTIIPNGEIKIIINRSR